MPDTETKFSRRDILKYAGIGGAALLTGCGSSEQRGAAPRLPSAPAASTSIEAPQTVYTAKASESEQQTRPYQLSITEVVHEETGTVKKFFVDEHLRTTGAPDFLHDLSFSYDPERVEGSLEANIGFSDTTTVVVATREEFPDPRWLVNARSEVFLPPNAKEFGTQKFPVTELGRDEEPTALDKDIEHVYIGVGKDPYRKMRHYKVESTEEGIQKITYVDNETLDPAAIQVRG